MEKNDRKMKIAYVVSMFPCWSETFILNELVDHRKNNVELSIFSLKDCSESMVHEEAKNFIADTIYPAGYLRLILFHICLIFTAPIIYFKILFQLLFLKVEDLHIRLKSLAVFALSPTFIFSARKQRIENLHAHFATYPSVLAWMISKFNEIPFTFTAHAHDIYVNQDLLPLLCSDAAKIIVISEYNKKFIEEKLGTELTEKIEIIHCGINLNKFEYKEKNTSTPKEKAQLNILSIGRLSGIKGFEYLLEALSLLSAEGISFKCQIIGEGPLRDELSDKVIYLGIEEKVEFLGAKKADEIPGYLNQADVFVLACARDKKEGQDGIPLVFMEAMAYGTPVIGTQLSGIPELIIHRETGLCATSEDPVSLKEEFEYFIENPQNIASMSRNARKIIAQDFDIVKNSKKLREIFQNVRNLEAQ